MSEKELIEKIRALLPSVETAQIDPEASPADTACAKCLEKDLLLQRCLESLRWIPVIESLPNKDLKKILVKTERGDVVMASYVDNSKSQFSWEGWKYEGLYPANISWTHWLPIPQ